MYTRGETKKVYAGNVQIGGGCKISVQSMCNTDTRDVSSTVSQIHALEEAGCDIIRVAVPDMAAAEAIGDIKKQINIPLVADIHFDYRLALKSIENGADKIRINPGNIGSREKTEAVVKAAKERGIPIRIGVNSGSVGKDILRKYGGPTADAIVESALSHIEILEDLDFTDIVLSLKSSDTQRTLEAYRKIAEIRPYPLHLGLTEAGTPWSGTVKSCAAIGAMLSMGLGDTIRVSLTGDPAEEVRVGRELLAALGLGGKRNVTFVSCPTCGRTRVNLIDTSIEAEKRLRALDDAGLIVKPVKVAVMGCAVNGPGEASDADFGLAGGTDEFLMFEKGEIKAKVPCSEAVEALVSAVTDFAGRK